MYEFLYSDIFAYFYLQLYINLIVIYELLIYFNSIVKNKYLYKNFTLMMIYKLIMIAIFKTSYQKI